MAHSYPVRVIRHLPRASAWVFGALLIVTVLLIIASFFMDGPLRRSIENGMNSSLRGYSVTIEKAHLSLFGPAVSLQRMIVRQTPHDSEPQSARTVALLPHLRASLQWRALLTGHLVSDFAFDKPIINISTKQYRKERTDSVKVQDRGWQQAAQEIFPFKINTITVNDGDFTYTDDEDPLHPIYVSHVNFSASNIRNIRSADHAYPSPIHGEGVLFGKGSARIDGQMDLLAQPSPAVNFTYVVNEVPLTAVKPMLEREGVIMRGGTIESHGAVEYSPWAKVYHIHGITLEGLNADYKHNIPRALGNVHQAVATTSLDPDYVLRIDTIEVKNSAFGMNRDVGKHPYRLFFTHANARMLNYSNRFGRGPAVATMQGKFMGSGQTAVRANFRPESDGPNFDLAVAVEGTDLTSMNEMLSAHGKLDVTKGSFAVYSQIDVANHRMNGYVKPIFKDVTVYDWHQDKNNNVFNQLYQLVVSGVAKLFEKGKEDEIVSRSRLSGPIGTTTVSTFELIETAFENAFIKAITPGFDKIFKRGSKDDDKNAAKPKRVAAKKGA